MRRLLTVSALVFAALGAQAFAAGRSERATIHFAGLQSATQCFPGTMRPREKRPVFLSWKAASGGGTPRDEFVYEIFMSRTSGGENFSDPNWTTQGSLRFETPKLPAGRYFVVRARGRGGQVDHNRVQRRDSIPACRQRCTSPSIRGGFAIFRDLPEI